MKKPIYGQHFLKHIHYALKAVEEAGVTAEDAIIEVGPGKGVLTKYLLAKAGFVQALEIDPRFINKLKEKFAGSVNFEVRHADARYVEWDEIIDGLSSRGYSSVKLVANLPYYMATQMVLHVLGARKTCNLLVVMVQDEVARRMCAGPGGKEYSSLSVAVQYYSQPYYVCKVPANAFAPPPRISSAIVRLEKRATPAVAVDSADMFLYLVRLIFTHRRKTLRNCLQGLLHAPPQDRWEQALSAARIDPQRRPETVSLEEFAAIYQCVGRWSSETTPA